MGIPVVTDEKRVTASPFERSKDNGRSDQTRPRRGDRAWSTSFPSQPTPFIGRETELAAITELLTRGPTEGQDQGSCQLLTLVGPGGVGKTRLALQVATRIQNRMADGAYYVALQAVEPADLVATIADAVGAFLRGQEDPRVQLLRYLSDKELLLVLDSFEHLLVTDIGLIPAILGAAPEVRLLVTSREVLNLQEEWLFPVRGLEIPDDVSVGNLNAYSAVQLFSERARHVRRDFSLAKEREGVVRICQLVEGMPLALELAASWLTTLGCAEIATEIHRHLSFLSTDIRDIPVRHHSIHAVFDESWNRLSEEEKAALKRLAVFSGGFEREAAIQVAGASLTVLSSLVDKSLLRREPDGRYQIHGLLCQYAAGQLGLSPESVAETRNRHCTYYAEFLYQRLAGIDGQEAFAQEVAAELGNVRAAWRWAVEQGNAEAIYKASGTWFYFCQIQGRYREGETSLAAAARSLEGQAQTPERDRTLAQVLDQWGWLCIRLGELDKARRVLEQSLALYQALGITPAPGMGTDPRTALGVVATVHGDYAEATRLGEEALQHAKARENSWNQMLAYYVLAGAALAQGELEAAGHYAGEGYATAAELNARWFVAYLLNERGHVARLSGHYGEARQHYEASYAMRQEFGDPEGMAVAVNHLGHVALLQADYAEAERLYRRSQAIYQEIGDLGGLATALEGLGRAACALGDYQEAAWKIRSALHIADDIQFLPLTLTILATAGELFFKTGDLELAVELADLAAHHPASGWEGAEQARRLLHMCETKPEGQDLARAVQRDETANLSESVAAAMGRLTLLVEEIPQKPAVPTDQPLVEPLTPRELQVLGLIGGGLSNQAIADELVLALGTVKWYTGQIYGKLGVRSRTQAVARARKLSILPH